MALISRERAATHRLWNVIHSICRRVVNAQPVLDAISVTALRQP